ncbi:MAG: hypothetical protein DMG31_04600, partial [Acidobacteria bacterium]
MRRRNNRRFFVPAITFALAILAVAGSARADEFRLKDGSKIVGTIVAFEDGTFKVQTSYGFAYVRKDSIAEIVPSEKKAAPDSGQPSATIKPAGFAAATPSLKPRVPPMPRPMPNPANAATKPSSAGVVAANVAPPTVA